VAFAAKALAEQMHDGLAARGLACVRVQVQVISADGQEHTRLWRHDGLLSALAVSERVRWQLAGWRPGSASPGGITRPAAPDQVVPAHGRKLGL
jgi:protein ImuB